jgi:hypothetical protein
VNKLKKAVLSLGVAAAIIGGGAVADVATSHNTSQAQAYTDGAWKFVYNCMPYPSGAFQWRDYNWWEEMWGARDGYVWKYNFYRYC